MLIVSSITIAARTSRDQIGGDVVLDASGHPETYGSDGEILGCLSAMQPSLRVVASELQITRRRLEAAWRSGAGPRRRPGERRLADAPLTGDRLRLHGAA
jgi:hypothetical protein